MKKREPVAHIMSTQLHTVQRTDTLATVVSLLKKHHVRHIPVVSGHKLEGIISRTDVNRLTFGALFEGQEGADEAMINLLTIDQVMTTHPRTVAPNDTVREVAEIFAKEEFHALPVVEGDNLVGIVTTTDVIKHMLEQY